MVYGRDPGFDSLLDLDGQMFFIDDRARFWVKFEVRRIAPDASRPHGLRYSLTLHDHSGRRLVGYDNAHGAWAEKGPLLDHRHRLRTVRPYDYTDAAALLADFWRDVDAVLKEIER